ncbi:MAG: hypothetical protein N3B21_03240 [Clostridia bacterium]|nr:hypothetical protein [Clostridia bacterium]
MRIGKEEKFVIKKVLIFFVILAILDVVLFKQKWVTLVGLFSGTVFGILKLYFMGLTYSSLLLPNNNPSTVRKSILRYVISQMAIILMLLISAKLSFWFFIGVTAGVLTVPLVVFINSITEGLGITHNNFE